jgi:choline dehydrogenase-like flavoprotein
LLNDARKVPDGTLIETDVCIIGGGAAGISMAQQWAGGSLDVTLLESGGLAADADTQALYRGRVFGRPYDRLDEARTRRFGGSTNCWHGMCRPLDALDFEERDWVPGSGWPFGLAELWPHYQRAQRVCGLAAFEYGAERWTLPGKPPIPFTNNAIESRVFQIAPRRFGVLYRKSLERARNVTVHLNANLVEFETDADARRVERAQVATLAGGRFVVRARHFVLATGGIENARLLLASRGARQTGLGNDHDLVGRYFMEHPHLIAGSWLPSSASIPVGFYRARAAGEIHVAGLLTPSGRAQREERILSFASFIARDAELPEFEGPLARFIAEMDGAPDPASRAVFFMNVLEQAPNPLSRVRLIEERDALGMPRVQLEWRLSPLDKRTLWKGHRLLARALGRAGLGRLQVLIEEDDHSWPTGLGGGRHHMGTTRMHVDPKRGVVDANCRVHGIANLSVAGSSVFPTSGSANPTLTLIALALRLAEHLTQELQ